MRSKLWALIAVCLLVVGGGVTCVACTYFLTGTWLSKAGQMVEECAPFAVLILLALVFRKNEAKSLTIFVVSIAILSAAIESCYPIITNPEDIFFPLLFLKIAEKFLFIILLPLLLLAHYFDVPKRGAGGA